MPDYADDILKDIADLQRGQAGQFAASQKRAPQTKASAGWEMPNRIEPQAPPNGAHIYAIGDVLRWKSADGSDYSLVPQEFPQGGAVASPANMTAGTSPASYNQDYTQRMRDDIADIHEQLKALLASLRAADIIAT